MTIQYLLKYSPLRNTIHLVMNDCYGDVKMNSDIPCCQADAVRTIRMIRIKGIPTGINMLDEVIAEVKKMNLPSDHQIRSALIMKVKIYNYIPKNAEDAYMKAILGEYHMTHASI